MGNKQSLKIILDSDKQDGAGLAVARAGTQMRGRVILKLDENHKGLNISLEFRGSENTFKTVSRGKVSSQTKSAIKHDFFEKNIVLLNENSGEIKSGLYTFPFEIDLPHTLPNSANSKRKWKVKYTLSCRITDPDRANLSGHECQRTVIVLADPLPDKRSPIMANPVTSNIVTRGSVNKGTVSLGARVIDSSIGKGEDLKVSIACRNHSTVEIARVKVQVVQEVVWFTDLRGTAQREENIILERDDVSLPSLLKHRQKKAMIAGNTESDDKNSVHREIRKDLMSCRTSRHTVDLSIPKCTPIPCFNTYHGKIVKVSHFVKVSLVTRVMRDHPFVKIPIIIGVSPPPSTKATLVSGAAIRRAAAAAALQPQPPQDEIPLVVAAFMPAITNEAGAAVAVSAPVEAMARCCELPHSSVESDDDESIPLAVVSSEEVRATLVM